MRLLTQASDPVEDHQGRSAISYYSGAKDAFILLQQHSCLEPEWTTPEQRAAVAKDLTMDMIRYSSVYYVTGGTKAHVAELGWNTIALISAVLGLDSVSSSSTIMNDRSMGTLFVHMGRTFAKNFYHSYPKTDEGDGNIEEELRSVISGNGWQAFMQRFITGGVDLNHVDADGDTVLLAILKNVGRTAYAPLDDISRVLRIWLTTLSHAGIDLTWYGMQEESAHQTRPISVLFPPTATLPRGVELSGFTYGSDVGDWHLSWHEPQKPGMVRRGIVEEMIVGDTVGTYTMPGQWFNEHV